MTRRCSAPSTNVCSGAASSGTLNSKRDKTGSRARIQSRYALSPGRFSDTGPHAGTWRAVVDHAWKGLIEPSRTQAEHGRRKASKVEPRAVPLGVESHEDREITRAHVSVEAAALERGESLLPAHAHQEGLETCRTLSFRAQPDRRRPAQDRAGRARVGERRFLALHLRGADRLCNRRAGPNEVGDVFA